MSKTFTDEEVQALIQAAVAKETEGLRSELDSYKTTEEAERLEAKIAEARAELEEKVNDLQTRLDEAVIQAQAATKERDEIVAWLEEEDNSRKAAEEFASLRAERVARVAEVVDFPETYVEENADRWTNLDEDAFQHLLKDYAAVAEKSASSDTGDSTGDIPKQTAMKAAREDDGGKFGSYRAVFALRRSGADIRTY